MSISPVENPMCILYGDSSEYTSHDEFVNSDSGLVQHVIENLFIDLILLYVPSSLCVLSKCSNPDNGIFSIEDMKEKISVESYRSCLKLLQNTQADMVIDIIDHILMRIDIDNIFMNDDIFNKLNKYLSEPNFRRIHIVVMIYRIIKCIIIGMIKIAVSLDTYVGSIADAFLSADNWGMKSVNMLNRSMRHVTRHDIKTEEVNKVISEYLITRDDVIQNGNILVISRIVNDMIEMFLKRSRIIDDVFVACNAMFSKFDGYLLIETEIKNSLRDIIVITACDLKFTNGKRGRFMSDESVIMCTIASLNRPYRSILIEHILDKY